MDVIRRKILSPFQLLFLLSICILIENTASLSLDSLHSSRASEDNSFKTALDNIHYRRSLAEKRRQPFHYESRYSKKNSHKWRDQDEDEIGRKYYQPYSNGMYSPSLSRNVERFLSEIGDEDSKEDKKKKTDTNKYEIRHEEELKPDGSLVEESKRKKRPYDEMEGPSRIFAHKSSPVTDGIQERSESSSSDKESEEESRRDLFQMRKKERASLLNYSKGNEHYSRFWDPERRSSNRYQRKQMHDIRSEEPDEFQNTKHRYSKRRSYRNQPLVKGHTNIKRSKDSKEQVLGELNEILKDEDEKREVKKRENDKDEKIAETKLDNSSDIQGKEPSVENGFDESLAKTEKEEGDKFNEWLRDEYFKTMAMTMATMKKKRGTWAPIVSGDIEEKIPLKQQLGIVEDLDEEKSQKFQAIEEKLQAIESAMLSDALQLIREGAEEREDSEAYGEQVLNKLYAANDLQKMREALDHLRRTMDHMRQYQDEDEGEENAEDDEGINTWPRISPGKREENLAKALRVMAPNQSKRQYPTANGVEPYLPRISMRSLPSFVPDDDGSSGHLVSVYDSPSEDTANLDTTEDIDCPALDLLSSDCSVLGDVVPGGPLKRLVLEACNWHEVCYSCGGSFGLSADECDVGFVEQSRTICQDDIPCQTTARMMLMPLRQRRVFFKRSVPAICYRDPCVERFLQHG